MRLKLLIVFTVSFLVFFAFRAYGDYTSGGFPAFGLMNFLYWIFLYSLIPLLPAYFVIQIISSSSSKPKQTSKHSLPAVAKVVITILAIIIGAWVGGYIGILFTADRSELDALTGGLYGAPIGAVIGLWLCWFFFRKRNRII